jgi:hypothetical protein
LHGVLKKIVPDRGTQFTLKFWERLYETLDTQLRFSSACHPQIEGQTQRVNQILEDMLRACALQYGRSWDKSLVYAEFSYNNSYQESLKMAPFELCCFGMRLENGKFSDSTYWKKSRTKFISLGKTFVSCSRDKRAMPTIEGEG